MAKNRNRYIALTASAFQVLASGQAVPQQRQVDPAQQNAPASRATDGRLFFGSQNGEWAETGMFAEGLADQITLINTSNQSSAQLNFGRAGWNIQYRGTDHIVKTYDQSSGATPPKEAVEFFQRAVAALDRHGNGNADAWPGYTELKKLAQGGNTPEAAATPPTPAPQEHAQEASVGKMTPAQRLIAQTVAQHGQFDINGMDVKLNGKLLVIDQMLGGSDRTIREGREGMRIVVDTEALKAGKTFEESALITGYKVTTLTSPDGKQSRTLGVVGSLHGKAELINGFALEPALPIFLPDGVKANPKLENGQQYLVGVVKNALPKNPQAQRQLDPGAARNSAQFGLNPLANVPPPPESSSGPKIDLGAIARDAPVQEQQPNAVQHNSAYITPNSDGTVLYVDTEGARTNGRSGWTVTIAEGQKRGDKNMFVITDLRGNTKTVLRFEGPGTIGRAEVYNAREERWHPVVRDRDFEFLVNKVNEAGNFTHEQMDSAIQKGEQQRRQQQQQRFRPPGMN